MQNQTEKSINNDHVLAVIGSAAIGVALGLGLVSGAGAADLSSESDKEKSKAIRPLHDRVLIRRVDSDEGKSRKAPRSRTRRMSTQQSAPKVKLEGEEMLIMRESDIPGIGEPKGSASKNKAKVKWFNPSKGYGFIAPDDGSKDATKGNAPPLKQKTPGANKQQWNFTKGWPSKVSGPQPKSDGNDKKDDGKKSFPIGYRPQFYFGDKKANKDLKQKTEPTQAYPPHRSGWPAKVSGPQIKTDQNLDGQKPKNPSGFGAKNPNNPAQD